MRHRDNQTGSPLLAWADRQLPVLNTLVEFCHGSIKGLIYFFQPFDFSSSEDAIANPSWFFAFWDVESFYACREKSVVTPDRLASLAHVWPRSSRRIGEGESRYSVNARPVLLIWFVCLLRLWGVVAQPKPWSIAPAARGLSWTAFCSTCWTEPGTSSACNAASANAIWQRNVFLEKGDYTAKTISLGKLDEDGRNPLKSNVFVLLRSFTFLLHTNNTQQVSRDKPWKKLYKDIYIFSKEGPKVVMAHSETRKLYKKPYKH